ncbi:lipoprotein [Moraxella nasibovis]|nr:lipoprotein [Moraxella nasibovis]WFF39067.1 lipoprotein [Moraxella nasibovis]
MKHLLIATFVCALLSACGQKGALYLPSTTSTAVTHDTHTESAGSPDDY